jgi:hypothetical protein
MATAGPRDGSARLERSGSPNGNGAVRVEASLNGNGSMNGNGRRLTSGRVLVLNASYEPLNVCTVRRAIVLLLKEKGETI